MDNLSNRINNMLSIKTLNPKKSDSPLYQSIYAILKEAILKKHIPQGSVLPATRQLSMEIGVSRSTVIKSYELLRLEGLLESVQGSGNKVKHLDFDMAKPDFQNYDHEKYPKLSQYGESFRKNINLINSTDDKSIAFRPGLPPLDLFPVNQWKSLSNLYWRHIRFSDLSYSPSSGIDLLKQNLASYLNLSRGIKCDYRQIVIVAGSLQSLYLLGNCILNSGDSIAMENPTFPNVHSIYKSLGANVIAVPLNDQGLDIGFLNQRKEPIKLLHTTPSCQYPTGIKMSLERRLEIIKWANENKSIIIENDYEHQIHNYYDNIPSIFTLDEQQRTVYLGTFNRILHPSIRIGYMVLPPPLVETVDAMLKHSHRFVAPSIQIVLNEFIEKNYLNKHVKKIISAASERLALFEKYFEQEFGDKLILRKNSVPSLHISTELPLKYNDGKVVRNFAQNNIISHTYSKCFIGENPRQGLIFGYASVIGPVMKRKIIKMGLAFKEN